MTKNMKRKQLRKTPKYIKHTKIKFGPGFDSTVLTYIALMFLLDGFDCSNSKCCNLGSIHLHTWRSNKPQKIGWMHKLLLAKCCEKLAHVKWLFFFVLERFRLKMVFEF